MLEVLDLGARHTFRHRLVPYVNRVVHPRDGLGCVSHGERVHFRAQADKLDDRSTLGLVLEVANFSGVLISITTSELKKVAITNLAKVEGVSKVRALDDFFCQVFHEEMKKERVGVRIQHSDVLSESIFEERVYCVPIKSYRSFKCI